MPDRDEKGRFIKGCNQVPWNKGKIGVYSEEYRKKLSDKHKGLQAAEKHPMYGKHHSEKTKKHWSNIRKGRVSPNKGKRMPKISAAILGQKNPMYGKVPWNKGISYLAGEKHPNWQGGKSFEPYCSKFNDELKEKIRERDNRTCQLCGIKENGKKLAVHHIHYDKENCAPDLISLCERCNSKVNFKRDHYENLFIERLKVRVLCV